VNRGKAEKIMNPEMQADPGRRTTNRQLAMAIRALRKIDRECSYDSALKKALSNEAAYALRDIAALGQADETLPGFLAAVEITEDAATDIMLTGLPDPPYVSAKATAFTMCAAFRALRAKCYIRRK
jgi:hypothetical protein